MVFFSIQRSVHTPLLEDVVPVYTDRPRRPCANKCLGAWEDRAAAGARPTTF